MKRLLYKTILSLSAITLCGCTTVKSWVQHDHFQANHAMQTGENAEQYLQLAAAAAPPQQQQYQFLAVERLIEQNQLTRAEQVLATVNTYGLSSNINTKKQLLFAKVQLADERPELALEALNQVPVTASMTTGDQRELHNSMATAYGKTNNIVASIEQRNLLDPLLPNRQAQTNNQLAIWELVQHLPKDKIDRLLTEPLSPEIRGWLELSQLAQAPDNHSNGFINDINRWRQSYPKHSGNQILPQRLDRESSQLAERPQHIYLMVPLHGKFAKKGEAIKNGFMTSYYSTNRSKNTPLTINIVDTSRGNIINQYQQAIREGADLIIGPLTKSKIQTLTESTSLTVPTVTLNYIPEISHPNLYQFGLSQLDEATQVAQKARTEGHRKAIIIAPEASWGQNIANQFKLRWESLGGDVIDTLAYHNTNDLSGPIRDLLQVNQSNNRAKNLAKLLHKEVRSLPNRRRDVDMIFLVALPKDAHSIQPMLKFYYAGDLPVYATSLIYQPNLSKNSSGSQDLDNIQFSEMPWVLGGLSDHLKNVQEQSKKLWKKSYEHNPKFYALGVDAFELSHTLCQLNVFPHFSVEGATGQLYLSRDRHIFRQLKWAKMHHGKPQAIHS